MGAVGGRRRVVGPRPARAGARSTGKARGPQPKAAGGSGPGMSGKGDAGGDEPVTGADGLEVEEVAEQLRALGGEEALGVELDAVQRPGAVADAHDLALL